MAEVSEKQTEILLLCHTPVPVSNLFSSIISGLCVYKDGSKYDGFYQDGKAHGPGVLTLADGTTVEGEWSNGKRVDVPVTSSP